MVSTAWFTRLTLEADYQRSSHVAFSPNSRFVLVSTQDSTIRLWNYQTSKCMKTYSGHTNRTYCIPAAFSITSGKYIISGSEDTKVYVWDLQSRQVLQILEGHRGSLLLCIGSRSTLTAAQILCLRWPCIRRRRVSQRRQWRRT